MSQKFQSVAVRVRKVEGKIIKWMFVDYSQGLDTSDLLSKLKVFRH